MANWMDKGIEDADLEGDPRVGGGAAGPSGIPRFWMPKGTDKKIVFLTKGKDAAIVWEHQVRINGKWQNWALCMAQVDKPCLLCDWAEKHNEFRRYKGCYFLVVDMTPFKDKNGKERVNERRILCAKKDPAELIKRRYLARIENGEDLRGAVFDIHRSGSDTSPNIGDDYQFSKMIDLDDMPDTEHPQWDEMLKPDAEKVAKFIEQLSGKAPEEPTKPAEKGGDSEGPAADHHINY